MQFQRMRGSVYIERLSPDPKVPGSIPAGFLNKCYPIPTKTVQSLSLWLIHMDLYEREAKNGTRDFC